MTTNRQPPTRGTGAHRPRHLPPRIHAVPVVGEDTLAADESLGEAESEIGQNEWIDPETGSLAEGGSPPRLEQE